MQKKKKKNQADLFSNFNFTKRLKKTKFET